MGVNSATSFVRPHSLQMRTPGGNLGFGPGLLRVRRIDSTDGGMSGFTGCSAANRPPPRSPATAACCPQIGLRGASPGHPNPVCEVLAYRLLLATSAPRDGDQDA